MKKNVKLSKVPQPEQLNKALIQAGAKHGQTALIEVENAIVDQNEKGEFETRFCQCKVKVLKNLSSGDKKPFSENIKITGFTLDDSSTAGLYKYQAMFHSNGTNHIAVKAETVQRMEKSL